MKTLFFAVDCQKDFILPNGKLYIKDAEKIIPVLSKLTQFAKDNNIQVVSTADYHTKKSKEISKTPDFVNTFPAHCMVATRGIEFIKATRPHRRNSLIFIPYDNKKIIGNVNTKRNVIILKDAFDVFTGNKHTEEVMKRINPNVVVVYGVASDICVNFAVWGLAIRGYRVIVVSDAIKNLPTANMVQIVNGWMNFDNVEIHTSDDVIKKFRG